ncbi:threonine synthase, partial [Petrachloros mirabilis]
GLNPTGSFKDRGMTLAVTQAADRGATGVMCASTGNTSASAAAYAAKAGLECVVLIPEGGTALGKIAQVLIYGAKAIKIRGNFDDALKIVREITAKYPIALVNSLNPYRLEGQKTAAFEVCDQLDGEAPDYHILPVGNAGNIAAYWMGYTAYKEANRIERLPKMIGFQAKGAAPIVRGKVVERPETIASAIRIGNPANWQKAVNAAVESDGFIDEVTDDEILLAQKFIASTEGIFCEPASAASIAGLLKLSRNGFFVENGAKTVVCTLTGSGLKDPDTIVATAEEPVLLEPSVDDVSQYVGLTKPCPVP